MINEKHTSMNEVCRFTMTVTPSPPQAARDALLSSEIFKLSASDAADTRSVSSLTSIIQDTVSVTDLPESLQLHILQFLDVDSLCRMLRVSRGYCDLLTRSAESESAVWKPTVQRIWPWLPKENISFVDSLQPVDTTAVAVPNYPSLVRLAPQRRGISSRIDDSLFAGVRWSPRRQAFVPNGSRQPPTFQRSDNNNNGSIQFTGTVGVGDRCLRADEPLPRPELLKAHQSLWKRALRTMVIPPKALLLPKQQRRSRSKDPSKCTKKLEWKPFVVPFVTANDKVDLTPRLISYFEVSILPATEESDVVNNSTTRPRTSGNEEAGCVAVGLAGHTFSVHNRMPGWDEDSFGYHGDDGGIYHHSGEMLKEFGPKFAAGDCIGCGVDYQQRAIFYTLNGTFLGYAFALGATKLAKDWFPVIGVDTRCPVMCNFGTDKNMIFQFDLQNLILRDKDILLQTMHQQQAAHPSPRAAADAAEMKPNRLRAIAKQIKRIKAPLWKSNIARSAAPNRFAAHLRLGR
jgi:SPRY domain/F-box domain